MRLRTTLTLFCLLACSGLAGAADLAAPGPRRVEVTDFPDLVDAARQRKVPMKLHLPAGEDALPLVLLSHGAGGSRDANFAQAQHLASHGYAVLALEHPGSNTEVLTQGLRLRRNLNTMTRDADEVLGRPRDMGFAIDQAARWNTSDSPLRGRFDLAHVGALGHSFGAYTVLALAGVRPALDWLKPVVGKGRGLGPDLRDARVACVVALSPQAPGEPFFIESSYATMAVPVLGITGSKDAQQGDAGPEDRRRALALWPAGDKWLVWIDGADHSAFSDSTGSGKRMLRSASRERAQPVVRAATLRFFDACLKGDATGREALSVETLRSQARDRIEVLTR
jgi:predicted dienelactone hydrolase